LWQLPLAVENLQDVRCEVVELAQILQVFVHPIGLDVVVLVDEEFLNPAISIISSAVSPGSIPSSLRISNRSP
jgi:hypothetical protein